MIQTWHTDAQATFSTSLLELGCMSSCSYPLKSTASAYVTSPAPTFTPAPAPTFGMFSGHCWMQYMLCGWCLEMEMTDLNGRCQRGRYWDSSGEMSRDCGKCGSNVCDWIY